VDLPRIEAHWERLVHLVASVHSGHSSAVHVTARFGSAARGDPFYDAFVHLGRLLRTVFLCNYSSMMPFGANCFAYSTAARRSTP
jgi:TnpA family transposase